MKKGNMLFPYPLPKKAFLGEVTQNITNTRIPVPHPSRHMHPKGLIIPSFHPLAALSTRLVPSVLYYPPGLGKTPTHPTTVIIEALSPLS